MRKTRQLSVIIPTLEEEDYIGTTIETLLSRKSPTTQIEIILIDSGSNDDTIDVARKFKEVQTFIQPAFKGKKHLSLNFGASKTTGNVLMFLDADSQVPEKFDLEIFMAIEQGFLGGAFHLRHDKTNFLLSCIEKLNTLRYSTSKWFYGDQGVFCTTEAFEHILGYPNRDIMESAFFCKRLKKIGKLKLSSLYMTSSSRRFYKHGILKVFLFDFLIWGKCLIGLSARKEAKKYWEVGN